jgi:hypothetical protein
MKIVVRFVWLRFRPMLHVPNLYDLSLRRRIK